MPVQMKKQINFIYLLDSKSWRSFLTYGINGIPVRYTSWQYNILTWGAGDVLSPISRPYGRW